MEEEGRKDGGLVGIRIRKNGKMEKETKKENGGGRRKEDRGRRNGMNLNLIYQILLHIKKASYICSFPVCHFS